MKTIISVKYIKGEGESQTISEREYSYFCEVPVEIGEILDVPVRGTWSKAVVSKINIPEKDVESIILFLKTITVKERPMFVASEDEDE